MSGWEVGYKEDVHQHNLSGITVNCFPDFLCLDSYILIDVHLVGWSVFFSALHISSQLSFEKLS